MSYLTKFKLVSAKKPTVCDPIVMRRNKLVAKIDEQIALANAIDAGSSYAPTRTKLVANSTTGLKERVAVQKRVKEWFWSCRMASAGIERLVEGGGVGG